MLTPQERGRRYEKKLAKELGYRTNSGSGNTWTSKADMKKRTSDGKFLIEAKYTEQKLYSFTIEDWEELERHAMRFNLFPVFILSTPGILSKLAEIVIISEYFFNQILEIYTEGQLEPCRGKKQFGVDVLGWYILCGTQAHDPETNTPVVHRFKLNNQIFTVIRRDRFEELKEKYERGM